jgi:PAS domain S-box-containing protein
VGIGLYLLTSSIIIGFGDGMRVAQRRAAEGRERLRTTLASIGDAVIATDTEGRITSMNAVAEALTGWTSAEALGQPLNAVFRIVNEQTRRPVENPVQKVLKLGRVVGLANHTILIAKDGTERPIDDSAAPIRCKEGKVVGCVLVFRDVTERRRVEQKRTDDAARIESVLKTVVDGIITIDQNGTVETLNPAAERLFGYNATEVVGQNVKLLMPEPYRHEHDTYIANYLRTGQAKIIGIGREVVGRCKDGRTFPMDLAVSEFTLGGRRYFTGIVRDITERRRAEEERQKFVTLVENSTDFIGMCDLEGIPFFVNRAGLQMVGLDSLEQARRTAVRDFFFPEDQAKITDEFFPSVLERGHGEIEVRFRHFQTGQARWMAYKVLTLTDATGRAVGLATVTQDVTERRRLEDDLRKLAADLAEADRRKNQFLATLAHELRNPLAPIRNAIQVLLLKGQPDPDLKWGREVIDRQVRHMARLLDDLLDVSRITHNKLELRKERIELSAVVQSAIETSRPLIDSSGQQLTVTLPPQPVYLDADPVRLAQVFSNLLNNASKYSEPGGHVRLTGERQGSDVVVSVSDDGMGIAAEMLPRLFDIFSQSKRALQRSREGLGIGLSLVRGLVELHGGRVEARSEGPDKGSEFVVRLPLVLEKIVQATPPPSKDDQPAGVTKRRLLIVDDLKDNADTLARLLQMMGHEVHTAYDGEDAILAAEKFQPQVVLLDIGMPKLNGYDVCRRIRKQPWGNAMHFIALTGWGQEDDRRRTEEAGFNHHLVKPVDSGELMKLLASLQVQHQSQLTKP